MIDIDIIKHLLRCPECHQAPLSIDVAKKEIISCRFCGTTYPIVSGRPIFLKKDNTLFNTEDYYNLPQKKDSARKGFLHFMPSASVNLSSRKILTKISLLLQKLPEATCLVVGAGKQRICLESYFCHDASIKLIFTDIDIDADVDIFCDGHDLPFVDESFDAVITTAVLEHVLYPERVASEIMRVLKVDGLLYSELPFIQQVHEGAYDFTRYTLSGHRRLFNWIKEIDAGMVAGPGTALVWSFENFILAFSCSPFYRKISKLLTRVLLGWIKYFDYILVQKAAAMDGASCTYLFGKKVKSVVADTWVINNYIGAKKLQHTNK